MPQSIPPGSELLCRTSCVITLGKLFDEITEAYPDDAVVTANVIDTTTGLVVEGADDIDLAYVEGSSGRGTLYRGTLAPSVVLVEGRKYIVRALVEWNGAEREFNVQVWAELG